MQLYLVRMDSFLGLLTRMEQAFKGLVAKIKTG